MEPVCEWKDLVLAGLGGHGAESVAQHPWALGWELQRHSPVPRSHYGSKSLGNGQVILSAALSQAETLLDLQQCVEQSRIELLTRLCIITAKIKTHAF